MPKRLLYPVALLLFSLMLTSSCKTDFNVNAPYKEQYVVYGLLDLHSPVQVIKITKLFQNSSTSTAYQGAKQIDSLYPGENVVVTLYEINNNDTLRSAVLTRYFDNHKDTGLFASPGQYLYATPNGFILNPTYTYGLKLRDTKTNVVSTAKTVLVGDITPQRPAYHSTVNFSNSDGAYFAITFGPGNNATSYDLDVKIPVLQYSKKDSSFIRRDTLDFNILRSFTQIQGKIIFSVLGQDFYSFLRTSLTPDPNVYRKLDSLDFDFLGAGADLTNYIEVNAPSADIVQKNTNYTNVTNGIGIFSARTHTHVRNRLSDNSFTILMTTDNLKSLNIVK